MRPGLCSVTLRRLGVEDVVAAAAAAGLEAIEWGADVHVPPGDLDAAERARSACAAAGLAVASYGSYFRAGEDEDFAPVLASARALGAPRIRRLGGPRGLRSRPGRRGDTRAWSRGRAGVPRRHAHGDARVRAGAARGRGQRPHLLAAAPGRARRARRWPGCGSCCPGCRQCTSSPGGRATSATRWRSASDLWRAALALAGDVDALLEFVPGDDPALLPREAATLQGARMIRVAPLDVRARPRAAVHPRLAGPPRRDRGCSATTPRCC